jgi:pimeloyl-ACP methyl ester carboxylesterase
MTVEAMQAVTRADPFGPVRESAMATDHGWVTGRLQIDGRSVHYRRSVGGQGPPLVHIHGFAISGAYLMPTARLLARRWVNVVPDLPGYGLSERRDHVLDIPALAQALLAVLDALDIEQAVLVGNSMGCPIGLEVAHEAPERVHGLILVSPAGGVQNQPLPRALGQLALDVVRESPRMVPVALPDYLRFGPVNGLRLFHELTLFPSLERLLDAPVPALAVLGGRDPLMPSPSRVREVGRLAPQDLAVVLVDRAAHAVNFSHPLALARVIESWLDGALPAGGARLPAGVRVVHVRSDPSG